MLIGVVCALQVQESSQQEMSSRRPYKKQGVAGDSLLQCLDGAKGGSRGSFGFITFPLRRKLFEFLDYIGTRCPLFPAAGGP